MKDMINNHGATLIIKQYNGSFINLIQNVCPNYKWLPWKFKQASKGYWNDENNIKEYMNWLSEKLNIKTMEDWYKITQKVKITNKINIIDIDQDIQQNHGSALIQNNNNSYIKFITSVYPNYQWLPWKFTHTPKGYWNDENNIKEYMNWLSEKLNIKSMEDWYKVSSEVN